MSDLTAPFENIFFACVFINNIMIGKELKVWYTIVLHVLSIVSLLYQDEEEKEKEDKVEVCAVACIELPSLKIPSCPNLCFQVFF